MENSANTGPRHEMGRGVLLVVDYLRMRDLVFSDLQKYAEQAPGLSAALIRAEEELDGWARRSLAPSQLVWDQAEVRYEMQHGRQARVQDEEVADARMTGPERSDDGAASIR